MGDSFTKFPNDLLEKIYAQKLTGAQFASLLYIVRKTYGFGKGDFGDAISCTKIAKETGYARKTIQYAIADLEKLGVLDVEHTGSGRLCMMRIRDISEWDKPVT